MLIGNYWQKPQSNIGHHQQSGQLMKIQFIFVIFLIVTLAGCAANKVVINATSFYVPEYKSSGSIAVVAVDEKVVDTLEYSHYKSLIESQLNNQGYSIAGSPQQAQFIAFISYGIDSGKTTYVNTPVIGQIGGGYRYNSGTIMGTDGPKTYAYTSYTMPTYGVVSSTTREQTHYTRVIALDIVEAKGINTQKSQKVYEGRAKSTGNCSEIAVVFSTMLDALFKDFPGPNGKVRVNKVDIETSC